MKKVEEGLARLGYPLKYEEIKNFQWYPRIIDEAIYFVIKRVLDWEDEVFRESGKWGAKVSYITRIMLRYILSPEHVFREANNYWRRYYTVGNLKPIEINLKERYFVVELLDLPLICPEHCRYWEGYFWQVGAYIVPKENLKLWETDCVFRGSNSHRPEREKLKIKK